MPLVSAFYAGIAISIHAPVKGATALILEALHSLFAISIHAPVKGATLRLWSILVSKTLFQSTHP